MSDDKVTAEEFDALTNFVKTLLAHLGHVTARIDAQEAMLYALGMKVGYSAEQIRKMLDDAAALSHQAKLEKVEAVDPGIAARLDLRPPVPELPDEPSPPDGKS